MSPFVAGRVLVEELDARVASFPNPRGATIGRRYFVRTKPARLPPGTKWHSLADLYAKR